MNEENNKIQNKQRIKNKLQYWLQRPCMICLWADEKCLGEGSCIFKVDNRTIEYMAIVLSDVIK